MADFDHKVRASARETTEPGSRNSPSKGPKGKRAAPAATVDSAVNLGPDKSPLPVDEEDVACSVTDYVDRDSDDESRGRSPRRNLLNSIRERSLSPRLYELVGRAFLQYFR